ncbi:hypothetical protein BAJUN_00060 [Bajunvirus bajun]|uniref:Uncharacterized protein n=1 Tax=Brevundimonas phage vB_BgoS-Bajun TaxID=2948594 RepID=A0A9E7N4A3_9CAUD|nr:hypothetical protein BAJUN_00060 [Brevundimonas phage vB_BgoS-Bajun]
MGFLSWAVGVGVLLAVGLTIYCVIRCRELGWGGYVGSLFAEFCKGVVAFCTLGWQLIQIIFWLVVALVVGAIVFVAIPTALGGFVLRLLP